MANQNLQDAANQVKNALDKIAAAKNNPQQLQTMIDEAKAKVDELVKQSEQD